MNKIHEPIRDVWEFEKFLATKPDVWISEAVNLRNSTEALILYDHKTFNDIFVKKQQPALTAFFSARVERMLMGFSLENLVKALLLQDKENIKKVFAKDHNLKWGKDGHNLLKLFQEAKINTDLSEKVFLELWQTCAIWAGRYPMPANENNLPPQRKGLPSQKALLKRRRKITEKAMAEGDHFGGTELNDLLLTSVGSDEIDSYREIFERCLKLLSFDLKEQQQQSG